MEPKYVDSSVDLEVVKPLFVGNDDEIALYQDQLSIINSRIAELELEHSSLFDVEIDRKRQIEDELGDPKNIHINPHRLDTMKLYPWRMFLEDIISFLGSGYNTWMPLDPLSWRNEETGLPVFALFSLNSPLVTFKARLGWYVSHSDGKLLPSKSLIMPKYYPDAIQDHYQDIKTANVLEERIPPANIKLVTELEISTKFTGMIPDHARRNIKAAIESGQFSIKGFRNKGNYVNDVKDRGHNIFLLTEVVDWDVAKAPDPKPVRVDPIVVGWTPFYPDRFWYIDSFDITPIENLVPFTFS